jgi:hypothetical protein
MNFENTNFVNDDIIAEVRRHREELLERYGGIEGYDKHWESETRPRLEKEGWKFVTMEEVLAQKHGAAPKALARNLDYYSVLRK